MSSSKQGVASYAEIESLRKMVSAAKTSAEDAKKDSEERKRKREDRIKQEEKRRRLAEAERKKRESEEKSLRETLEYYRLLKEARDLEEQPGKEKLCEEASVKAHKLARKIGGDVKPGPFKMSREDASKSEFTEDFVDFLHEKYMRRTYPKYVVLFNLKNGFFSEVRAIREVDYEEFDGAASDEEAAGEPYYAFESMDFEIVKDGKALKCTDSDSMTRKEFYELEPAEGEVRI